MFELVKAGGWLMYPILACSVIAMGIIIERFWALRASKVAPRKLLAQVWVWIQNTELDKDKLKALKQQSMLGSVFAAGLNNSSKGREVMKESLEEQASHVAHEMERYLNTLGTVASITPLLGLLGTVIGMIKVFNDIMLQGTGNANVLAGGISEALITTAAGLTVAIPAMIFYRYFTRKIDEHLVFMEQESIKLVEVLQGNRKVDMSEGD